MMITGPSRDVEVMGQRQGAGSPAPRQRQSPTLGQGGSPSPGPSRCPCPCQGACSGVLRGIGKQKFGAILNAVGYYGVGLPLGAVLLFVARIGIIGTNPQACSSAWPQIPSAAPPSSTDGSPRPSSALLGTGHNGVDWDGPCNY